MKPSGAAIDALCEGRHADPFALLGLHQGPQGLFARALLPGAEVATAFSLDGEELGVMTRTDPRGLFEGKLKGALQPVRYRAGALGAEWFVTDPYTFAPVLGPIDDYLINEGSHLRLLPVTLPLWAISTIGTITATRCAAARTLACGKFSSPTSPNTAPINTALPAPMGWFCR